MSRSANAIPWRLIRRVLLGAVVPALVLLVWHGHRGAVVPGVGEVLAVLARPFDQPVGLDSASLGAGLTVSVLRVGIGFGLAALTAIPIGVLLGRSSVVRDLLGPTLSAVMAVSPIAWMPVAILVFGFASVGSAIYGDEAWRADLLDQLSLAVLVVIWVGAFFPIALATAGGTRGVRDAHVEAVRVLGAGRWSVLSKVILPASVPSMVTGLRLGAGVAWRVMVAAEFFPGTRSGLGHMILTALEQAEYRYAFAAIIVIAMIGLVADGTFRLLGRAVGHWQQKER